MGISETNVTVEETPNYAVSSRIHEAQFSMYLGSKSP